MRVWQQHHPHPGSWYGARGGPRRSRRAELVLGQTRPVAAVLLAGLPLRGVLALRVLATGGGTVGSLSTGQRPVDPAEALATLLLSLGVAPSQIPADGQARELLWRDRLSGKKVLLVLDDAAGPEQVNPLLPGTAGSLVITSRCRLSSSTGDFHENCSVCGLCFIPKLMSTSLAVCTRTGVTTRFRKGSSVAACV